MRWLHARELLIQSLILEDEFVVINAQLMQNRRVKVADMDGVLDDVVRHLIRLPVNKARLHSAPGQPHAEAARMMVPAIVFLSEAALAINRAPKFTAPNH